MGSTILSYFCRKVVKRKIHEALLLGLGIALVFTHYRKRIFFNSNNSWHLVNSNYRITKLETKVGIFKMTLTE